MCGRFNVKTNANEFATLFDKIKFQDELPEPNFNIAPTDVAAVVAFQDGERISSNHRWGLIPSWAKDIKFGYKTINARSETADTKPSFRSAFKKRRCLIPASGYYEWKKLDAKTKQPFNIQMQSDNLFAMAGLWESWTNPTDQQRINSFTILTTDSNELTADVHDRMPVILDPTDFEVWLDPEFSDATHLKSLMKPFNSERMKLEEVSSELFKRKKK
jgi:putative SOS response-associated peptidase YedK